MIFVRERLATAARAAETKESIIQCQNRRQKRPAMMEPPLNRMHCSAAPLGLGYLATSSPVPPQVKTFNVFGVLPNIQRPPTPPSETELDQKFKERGMGLHIGDVF